LLSTPLLVAAGLILFYLLFGWLAVDPLARRLLPWIAERQLDSRMAVRQVRFDPLRLQLTVDGLQLGTPEGGQLAGFERLFVDLESDSLFRFAWHLRAIELARPYGAVEIRADGTLNWSALLAKLNEDNQPSTTLPRVVIDHLKITDGKLVYAEKNRSDPTEIEMTPLALELGQFSTLPEDRGDYLIAARFDGTDGEGGTGGTGGTLRWKGNFGVNPLASTGSIAIEGLQLPKLYELLHKPAAPLEISDGKLGVHAGYDMAMVRDKGQTFPHLRLNDATVALDQLAASPAAGMQLALQHLETTLPRIGAHLQPNGQIRVQPFDLQARELRIRVEDKLQFGIERIDATGIAPNLQAMRIDVGSIVVAGGELRSTAADGPRARLEQASLTEIRTHLEEHRLAAHTLALSGMQADVIVNADKTINWVALLQTIGSKPAVDADKPVAPATPSKSGSKAKHSTKGKRTTAPEAWPATPAKATTSTSNAPSGQPSWAAALEQLRIDRINLHVEDRGTTKPVVLDVQDGEIAIDKASLDLSQPLPLKLKLPLRQGGLLEASGQLSPQPARGELQLRLGGLQLKTFAPYLSQVATLTLKGGQVGAQGKLSFDASQTFSAKFAGGFSVDKLDIDKEAEREHFLSWDKVASDSLRVSLAPNRLQMNELRIAGIKGQLIIHEDKSLNVQQLMRSPTGKASTKPGDANKPAQTDADAFPVSIERVSLRGGDLDFADLSLLPQFGTRVHDLEGVINGLSSDPAGTAQVELDGKVDDFGSARLRGSVQPFRATEFTDLKASFRNLEMNRLTPYSGKFAGRKIESGKLSLDLEYKVKNRQLVGENKVVINTLKLGERVDSKEAMNLPLDLAIAVLEDSDGVIDLDLPITGSLDDPQFSYGKIVWKAIVNVVQKIVTAPFRALGKLLGISAEQLEAVAFDPGSARLAPPEQEKLKAVAGALGKRAALSLKVVPAADAARDTAELQELRTRRDVLAEAGVKLADNEQAGPLDLANVKIQTAIENLLKDRSGGKRGLKMVDNVKDYFRKSKPEDLPKYAALLEQLKATVPVPDAQLNELAAARAKAIRDYLVEAGLDAGRVQVADTARVKGDGKSVPVAMTLDTARRP
jgi:outer membrane protein OmpA-like peptidoglycan-associated protein